MFLEYGIDDSGGLIWIGQATRGVTPLHCPYCGGLLTAKKGSIKGHHFAHAGETCRQIERDQDVIAVPAFDNFNLHLSPRVLKELHAYHADPVGSHVDRTLLEQHDLLTFNQLAPGGKGNYELTQEAKLVLGELPLGQFNELQETLIHARHNELEMQAYQCYKRPDIEAQINRIQNKAIRLKSAGAAPASPLYWELMDQIRHLQEQIGDTRTLDLETALSDLRLYRAQWRRILLCSLYFLEINGGVLHKIGVTTRNVDARIAEVITDLQPHLSDISVRVLGVWPHRGNVELYFKYRYKDAQQPIGSLTEYYMLDDVMPILRDLKRMKDKVLTKLEYALLNGEASAIEQRISTEGLERQRRLTVQVGIHRAAKRGNQLDL